VAKLTRIKILNTGSTTTAPANLKTGEFAYSWRSGNLTDNGDRLYIGTGTESGGIAPSVDVIGGKYFTGLMLAQTSPGVISTAQNPDTAGNGFVPILDSDRKVDQWNVDNIRLDGNTISTTNTNGNLTIDPAGSGKLILHDVYIGADDVSLAEFIYDTVGGAVTGGTGITVANSDVGNTSTVSITDISFTNGSAGTEYGSAVKIPAITVNGQGQVTRLREFDVATTLTVDGDSSSTASVSLIDDDLQILGTTNEVTTAVTKVGTDVKVTIGLPDDVTIGSDLTVTDNLIVNGNVTLGNSTSDTVQTQGSLTVGGNLTVQGTTTSVNSSTITLNDPVLVLADNATSTADSLDRGVRFKYGDGSSVKEGFFGFDMQTERFVFTKDEDFGDPDTDNASAPWSDAEFGEVYTSKVTTSSGNLVLDSAGGTIDINDNVDISGSLVLGTDLAVAHGGTGVSSFTAKAVVISNGSGNALSFLTTSTAGSIVQFDDSSNAPVVSNIIDGGTY